MAIRTVGNILVLGVLCLTLYKGSKTTHPQSLQLPQPPVRDHFPDSALEGEYSMKVGWGGQFLTLHPGRRFTYKLTGCIGGYNNQGSWEQKEDTIVLHPEDRTSIGHESLNLRFIPIQIEDRLYLVDENEMPSFCHSLYSKSDQEDITWYHFNKNIGEAPSRIIAAIPSQYRDFVKKGEIVVRVRHIDENSMVTLEGQDITRLQPGMHLCWRTTEGGWKRELRILDVHQGFARARQISLHEKHEDKVRPYDLFTTGVDHMSPAGTGMARE